MNATNNKPAAIAMTALETLKAAVSKDKGLRHVLIVQQCATMVALALANQAPKGLGNPGDWKQIPAVLEGAKLGKYAQHAASVMAYMKGKARTVDSWEEALKAATDVCVMAFQACAPAEVTPEQEEARKAKREAGKAERADKAAAETAAAREALREEVRAEVAASFTVTGEMVAGMIAAGAFSEAELTMIADAIKSRPVSVAGVAVREFGKAGLAIPA